MASIMKCASEVIDTARDGIIWFALWKTGRSWHVMEITAEYFDCETATYVLTFPEDKQEIERILAEDPNAAFLNGYYCNLGDPEEMTVNSLADALRWQYESGGNLLDWTFKSETEQGDCGSDAEKTANSVEMKQATGREEKENTMKKQYKEIRKIRASALRQLCIEKDWYTAGDNEEYGHLLCDLTDRKGNLTTADIIEIAEDIMEHSEMDSDCTVECVAFEVARIADVFFKEI